MNDSYTATYINIAVMQELEQVLPKVVNKAIQDFFEQRITEEKCKVTENKEGDLVPVASFLD